MSWTRRVCAAVVVVLAFAAFPRAARACSCISGGPPCQVYFQSDAIFVGTVRTITVRKALLEGTDQQFDRKFVRLSIERAVRGVQGTEIDLWTGVGGGDCGYAFKTGERYVVYAYRHKDGSMSTGTCSRTRPVSEAAEDLAYFSALPATGKGARVFGTITHSESDPATRRIVEFGGVPDVQVLVRGSAGVFSGMTDAEGRYAIDGVPPGAYDTEILPPPVFSTRNLAWKFEITDARACQRQEFFLRYAGRVTGTVLDASGRPAADVHVEIAPAGALDEPLLLFTPLSRTDANGQFELGDVPPGSYVVGVGLTRERDAKTEYPRTTFPPVEVGRGNRVDAGVLRLRQPLARYELRGVVVGADGAPIEGAFVYLQGARFRQVSTSVRTASDGSFTLPVFEGQNYAVRAYYNYPGETVRQLQAMQPVTVSGEPDPVRLVLKSPR